MLGFISWPNAKKAESIVFLRPPEPYPNAVLNPRSPVPVKLP